jgi:hypothetical protein
MAESRHSPYRGLWSEQPARISVGSRRSEQARAQEASRTRTETLSCARKHGAALVEGGQWSHVATAGLAARSRPGVTGSTAQPAALLPRPVGHVLARAVTGVPFDSPPLTVRRASDQLWEVVEPLVYRGRRDTFVVPAGFRTDFASVPRVVVWLIPSFGRYTPAAVLHDWLVTTGLDTGAVSSRDADGLFRRVLRELEVPPVRRWLMWCGVR